jgi:GxxExxY protein
MKRKILHAELRGVQIELKREYQQGRAIPPGGGITRPGCFPSKSSRGKGRCIMITTGEWNRINSLSAAILKSAYRVHTKLGPGLLESFYRKCLAIELAQQGIRYECEKPAYVEYDGVKLTDVAYRYDLVVEDMVVIELKAQDELKDIHKKQLLTYLRLGCKPLGLLLNFNEISLKNGIVRMINQDGKMDPKNRT